MDTLPLKEARWTWDTSNRLGFGNGSVAFGDHQGVWVYLFPTEDGYLHRIQAGRWYYWSPAKTTWLPLAEARP